MDWEKLKGAKIRLLPFKAKPIFYEMRKQTPKIEVPPREERLDQMGDPKPPKMGGITPTKVELPEVDDLLEKLKKVTAPLLVPMLTPDWKFIGFDVAHEKDHSHCHVNCKCPPCLAGYCSRCDVEARRDDVDRTAVRALVAEYRGAVIQ